MTVEQRKSDFNLPTDTPYLAFTCELWSVCCEDLGDYWAVELCGVLSQFAENNDHETSIMSYMTQSIPQIRYDIRSTTEIRFYLITQTKRQWSLMLKYELIRMQRNEIFITDISTWVLSVNALKLSDTSYYHTGPPADQMKDDVMEWKTEMITSVTMAFGKRYKVPWNTIFVRPCFVVHDIFTHIL